MDNRQIVSLYERIKSIKAVSKETGFSISKVRKILVDAGVYKTKLIERVQSLAQKGYSTSEIKNQLHISDAAINTCLPYSRASTTGKNESDSNPKSEHALNFYAKRNEISRTGEKIAFQRILKGIKQSELAQKIGTTQKDISRWENGRRHPRIEVLMKIAKILKCSLNDLIGEDGET